MYPKYLIGERMKRLLAAIFLLSSTFTFAATQTLNGYLVDVSCATDDGSKPGFGAKHSKKCLQMPDCEVSGYALLTSDNKVIKFDKAGNATAKQFIAKTDKDNDWKVNVTGDVTGDNMTVQSLELQK
jgi:hypothetical protein